MKTVVVVDIGNTSTTLALAQGGKMSRRSHHPSKWTDRRAVAALIRRTIGSQHVDGSVLCSVVPKYNRLWLSQLRSVAGGKTVLLNHKLKLGVGISYPRPATIGADRLANACGAVHKFGAPVIVADFGTALTFDVVTSSKQYIGGVIAPGLPLMTDYLADKTALLPRIDLVGHHGKIGRSTEEAMRIGAGVGYRGIVREVTLFLQRGLGLKKVILCATGGYARWALRGLDMPFKFDPNLTLYGLNRIFDLNCRNSEPAKYAK